MGKEPRKRQKSDARRIGEQGTGKLDRNVEREAGRTAPRADARRDSGPLATAEQRARLEHERDVVIEQLRQLGISSERDLDAPRADANTITDHGDAAQASERDDLEFARRERLATRINELTAGLERLARGTYGTCEACNRPIERERLAAMPEARTCVQCQAKLERPGGRIEAA